LFKTKRDSERAREGGREGEREREGGRKESRERQEGRNRQIVFDSCAVWVMTHIALHFACM